MALAGAGIGGAAGDVHGQQPRHVHLYAIHYAERQPHRDGLVEGTADGGVLRTVCLHRTQRLAANDFWLDESKPASDERALSFDDKPVMRNDE